MAQPAAAGQEQFRAGHSQGFQRLPQPGTAGGDGTILPPFVESGAVSHIMPDWNAYGQVLPMKEFVNPLDAAGSLIQGQVRNGDVFVHQGVVHRSYLPFSFCSRSRQQATAQWFPSDFPHLLIKLAFPL